jgi:hypothetical protein
MMNEMTTGNGLATQRERELAEWAGLANQEHDLVVGAARQSVAHALQAGQALLEAKRICLKGAWTVWLAGNFNGSLRTAQGYMRLATHWNQVGGDPQRVADLNYREVTRLLTGLSRSDGRINHGRRSNGRHVAAPEAAAQAESACPVPSDRFAAVGELLRQAIGELRRIIESSVRHAPFARHVLGPLERICDGLARYPHEQVQ